MTVFDYIEQAIHESADPQSLIADLRAFLHAQSLQQNQPIDHVQWISIDRISPNDYNPNSVAKIEMGLLATSIRHDGYTQPIVTIYDSDRDLYVIVDGFHRYYTMRTHQDIYESCLGLLPVVVINKDINDRMASTVRHNRARGKHSVQGMSQMVFSMLENGWDDADICNELGMGPEELLRLKHVTGFSKLFADVEYQRSWITTRQARIAKAFREDTNPHE